jgi:RHS repeat-associated protein
VVATVSRTLVNNHKQEKVQYYHHDALGSVDVITDPTGTSLEPQYYDAWGQRLQGSWGGPPLTTSPQALFGYTGHQHDQDFARVNLVNMVGRHYDPKLGRFLVADPVGVDPYHSQALNRYSYVYNSPTNFTDPTGYSVGDTPPPAWWRDVEMDDRPTGGGYWGGGSLSDQRASPAQDGLAGWRLPGSMETAL